METPGAPTGEPPQPKQRVTVFIDWQNTYKGARQVFGLEDKFHAQGQYYPVTLAQRIVARYIPGQQRELVQVRIYSGRPDPRMDRRTYAAHMRQVASWEKTGLVVVRSRQLRYPREWPHTRAEEKGIDVQLAIDYVMRTLRGDFDIGIIFSTDTDLLPALEGAVEIAKREGRALPEVAAWRDVDSGRGRSRLNISGIPLRCHFLDWADYIAVADRTDYNIAPGTPGAS